ncbi:MAG TPA: DEAD/DEAH box helicase [Ktedonobacterales bacterium]|nr:DEAD/DEAH box helicase [Ktedonobacterales bacterium]
MGDNGGVEAEQEQPARITLEWRGRDLALIPPVALWPLADDALYAALFGPAEAQGAQAIFARDRRGRCLRARPMDFSRIKAALLAHSAYPFAVAFDECPMLPWQPQPALEPRPYQQDALTAWRAEGCRGVVVLPTGAGKTLVGALAIAEVAQWTLVVVPTIDLLAQWSRALAEALLPGGGVSAETGGVYTVDDLIGVYGGGAHEIRPITITTYESAQLHPELLRRYGLLIFDECHHLPAPTYRQIAEGAFTPLRLGLSATPERADQEHLALNALIGPEVYRRQPEELAAAQYLAAYDEERLNVALDPDARQRYETARAIYSDFIRRRRLTIASPADFQRKILWASARDSEAREAMLAWREFRALALNAPAKLTLLEELFARHRDERVLVFSEYNQLVGEVSRRFCIPQITYKTPAEERRLILEGFRVGRFSKLATGRVLNEGVDIPDCSVAIIVSGNATRREYIQRLGRVLRPKQRRAILYELVTEDTTEERIVERRRE